MELRRFQTTQGEIWLRGEAQAFDSDMPILLALACEFAPDGHAFLRLQPHFPEAAVLVGHIPGNHCPHLRETTVEAFGAGYSEVISSLSRPTVALGDSVGALVALAMRTPCLRGQVLLEPPLKTAKLWPLVEPFRKSPPVPDQAPLISNVFGYFDSHVEERDYRYLLGGVAIPTQVFWGAQGLGDPRPIETSPSFVDEPERTLLRLHPWVRAVLVSDAGHQLIGKAAGAMVQACQHMLAEFATQVADGEAQCGGYSDRQFADRSLVSRTPLTARRVLYIGDAFAAFSADISARNPSVELERATPDDLSRPQGVFDCVVVSDLRPEIVPQVAPLLRNDGDLIAAVVSMPPGDVEALRAALAWAGLKLTAAHDPKLDYALDDVRGDLAAGLEAERASRPLILAARKTSNPPQRMVVQVAGFSRFRLDIRTRLPLEGMRSTPDLAVALGGAPAVTLPVAADRPKILILQRPSPKGFELWRAEMAQAIRQGWITVMEFDDHPDLMTQMGAGESDWRLFGFTHAVQTSTSPLEDAFRPWNPEVKAFANAVFALAPFRERSAPHRIFYGAMRRGPFGAQIAASMTRVVAMFPDAEFVVVGEREFFEALPGGRKQFHELQTYERYLEIMSTCSISLAPIEPAALQETKSDAKFLDASSLGLLTIASPTAYERTLRHGETGLIAERIEDWPSLVVEALQDEAARHRIARAAWAYVREQRMFAYQLPDRLDWYRSLWERRDALTAGLVARVPGLAAELAA